MGGGFHGGFGKKQDDRKIDFYVGPNGGVLPAKYKKWIGVNRRERLLKYARNKKLRNAVMQLYREGSFIGDGGTASILKFEKRTGLNTGRMGNSHYQKAVDMSKYLSNRVLKESLKKSERKMAAKLLKSLRKAIVEWEG
ncbi:MAG TPA: hypothetical protein DEO82_05920 [Eubacterium sp.]|nr:hypothetical protein [Eubacterium sp.]